MCAAKIDKSMSKLLQNSPWKIEITFPAFLYLHGENCLPALFYIICRSTAGKSVTPIVS